MNRRRMLMLKKQGQDQLPQGYTRLEFIQSRPNSYLSIPYKANNNTVIRMRCSIESYQTNVAFFGGNDTDWKTGINLFQNQQQFCGRFGHEEWSYYRPININHIYEITFQYRKLIIDDTVIWTGGTVVKDMSTTQDLYIFARNNGGQLLATGRGNRIHEMWISELDNNIHHFLPCLDNYNTPCLYDTVTKQTFYDQGGASFYYELSVSDGLKSVNLLKADGNQYITTDFIPQIGDEFEFKFKLNYSSTKSSETLFESLKKINEEEIYKFIALFQPETKRTYFKYFTTGNASYFDNLGETSPHIGKISGDGTFEVVGKTILEGEKSKPKVETETSLTLFSNVSRDSTYTGQLGYFKATRNGVVVLNLVPCLDINNKCCMYDTVSGKTYYNQGTGSFSYS